MKLDEYVKQTLVDIINGVSEAKNATRKLAAISPDSVNGKPVATAQMVSFEIVVGVEKEVGGGISVISLGSMKGGAATQSTNRISFEVPVYFQTPHQ